MSGSLWALLAVRVAIAAPLSDGGADSQRTHELEWARETPLAFATELPGSDVDGRVAIAHALGRLRDPDALELLSGLRTDPEERVRVAAAESLGWTPGAVSAIHAWWDTLTPPSTPYGRALAVHGEAVALLGALGHQGDTADVPLLREALRQPWPIGGAAARALGRMAIRKVPGAQESVPDVCARLDATDPRMVADAAWALSRLGLDGVAPSDLQVVVRRLSEGGTYETTRAWLVKAAWAHLDDETRDRLFIDGMTDPSRLVRVAVLNALRPEDVSADVLASWLADPDPWVRLSAIDALGREGTPEALDYLTRRIESATDPYEQAAAIRAAARGGPGDPNSDPIVRAAWLEAQGDPAAFVTAALDDPSAMVRTAAVGALLEREDTSADVGERLLAAKDPAIREAAIELVGRAEPKSRARILLVHLRVEDDPDVLGAGLTALKGAVEADPKAVSAKDPYVDAILRRTAARLEPRVRTTSSALATALKLDVPVSAPTGEGQRQLVLPSGTVVEVAQGRPAIETVGRIRGARVETSEGTFSIALDPELAPMAVANFASLAEAGFFDGMVFHRVIPGFVAQTGCPRGDGWGGPGYTIPDEVSSVPYDEGAVGMARSDRDTGGSQWFVATGPQPHLAGEYTRFGEVTDGMYVVKRLRPGSRMLHVTIERVASPP